MQAIQGIYDNGKITLEKEAPCKYARVTILFYGDADNEEIDKIAMYTEEQIETLLEGMEMIPKTYNNFREILDEIDAEIKNEEPDNQ